MNRDSGGCEVVADGARDRFNDGGDFDPRGFAGADGACDLGSDRPQAGDRELQWWRGRAAQRPFRGKGR